MFSNYLKIAIRSLDKNPLYSSINILGLSIGISASLLILLFVSHEFTYDRFHAKADRIYQVTAKSNYGGQEINSMGMSAQLGATVLQNDARVENQVRIKNYETIIKVDGKDPQMEKAFIFADASFFEIFSFPVIKGNVSAFSTTNKIIISERASKKYFGEADPIGKILTCNKNIPFEVVGVAKNPPSNSSFQFDFAASFNTLGTIESEKDQFNDTHVRLGSYRAYLLLKNSSDKASVESTIMKVAHASADEKYILNPFIEKHLTSEGSVTYLYGFSIIAGIILLLALINYMSLTTARATLRAREVGIRKVIGAGRKNLSAQFFLESTLMTVVAFILAVVWIELLLPTFLQALDLTIDLSFIKSQTFLIIVVALFFFCVFASGSYPALVLSRFKPVETLKGKLSSSGQGSWLRKSFTTFQFAASIGLILCSIIIVKQMDFLKNRKLGLTREMVMVATLDYDAANNFRALKNELRNQSGVMKVSSASFALFNGGTSGYFTQSPVTKEDIFISTIDIDEQFFSTLDVEWSEQPHKDQLTGKLIVNESGLTKLKMTPADLGKTLRLGSFMSEITGIVKDFNFESLRFGVNGMVMSVHADTSNIIAQRGGAMYIRFSDETQLAKMVPAVQAIFKKYQGGHPFEYYFLDDAFDKLFKSEDRLSKVFNVFTSIAIFIACLGLLGLVTFTGEVRTKEIGIRKILGASVRSIMLLLTKDYFILIAIGMFIATPIAWWYMQSWLNGFTNKIEIAWWYVPLSAVLALGIAFVTTCYQALRCATRNPVDSLKSE
ncbi:ABC transporter permease [Cytophagales bacterium WSM2-2]|nr:ABC transporter permease [Cytophagales bacterium WSM2-2]